MKTLAKLYLFATAFCFVKDVLKESERQESNRRRLNSSLTRARGNYYSMIRAYENRYGKIIK